MFSTNPQCINKLTTILYFLAFIALGSFVSILGPTLPALAEHTRSNLAEIGFLFTARSFGYLIGSLRGGRAFDSLPGHKLLAGLLLAMSASLALAPVISELWILTLVLFVLGIGEGALDVGVNLLLVWVHRKNATPFLNALHFFFGIGSFLGPILVAQALRWNGDIHWAYWILALYPLALVIGFIRIPGPTTPQTSTDDIKIQVPISQVVLVTIFFALYVGAEAGFGGWIYSYALAMNLDNETGAAILTSIFWGAITLGRLASIPIAAHVRPLMILSVDLVGSMVAISLLYLFPQSRLVLWAGTIFLGLSLASIFPTMLSFAGRRMPLTGNITRWFFVGAGAGGMSLPLLIGFLFEAISPRLTLIAILVDLILAMLVFIWSASYQKTLQERN